MGTRADRRGPEVHTAQQVVHGVPTYGRDWVVRDGSGNPVVTRGWS